MFDPSPPEEESLPDTWTDAIVKPEKEILFPYLLTETETKLVPHQKNSEPLALHKVRIIYLKNPEEQKFPHIPVWLYELVGWGVFLTILASFLGLQIFLTRLFSGPLNQFILILTVVAEIALIWRWDQYWY
jgi:hypothetical protein